MSGHLAVIGLGFGDEGKGAWVDRLAHGDRRFAVNVRFNGGAQAAHNVVADRHHTFRSFGSGTLAGVPTLLDQDVLVDPYAIAAEIDTLTAVGVRQPWSLMNVHEGARLVTPWHALANRARERARGTDRHGSCGLGIGETAAHARAHPDEALRVGDLRFPAAVESKLRAIAARYAPLVDGLPEGRGLSVERVREVFTGFASAVGIVGDGWLADHATRGSVLFEGAQGVLLDEDNGFHPHTTWSHTGSLVPDLICAREGLAAPEILGVTRTYHTRHGAGPFPSEGVGPDASTPHELHNGWGEFQGGWRAGAFDAVIASYAARAAGRLDGLLVSHLDAVSPDRDWTFVAGYRLSDGTVLHELPEPPHAEELERQQALGSLLDTLTPTPSRVAPHEALEVITEAFGRPVVGVARGPHRGAGRLASDSGPISPPALRAAG